MDPEERSWIQIQLDSFLRHCSIATEVNAKFLDLMDENSAVLKDLDHPLAEDLLEVLAKAADDLNKLDAKLNKKLFSTAMAIVLGEQEPDQDAAHFDLKPYQEVFQSLLSFREHVSEFEDIMQNVKLADVESTYQMKMMLQYEFDYLIARYSLFKHEDKLATVFCKLITDIETFLLEESVTLAADSFPRSYEQYQTILSNIGKNLATFKLYESGAIDLDTVVKNWKPNGRILKLMLEHHRIRFRQNLVDVLEISPRNKGYVSIDNINALSPTSIELRTPEKEGPLEDPLADTPHRGRPLIWSTDQDDETVRRKLFTSHSGGSSLLEALDLPSTSTSVRHSKEKTPFQIHEDLSEDQNAPFQISGLLPSTSTSVPHSKKKTPFQIHEDSSEDQNAPFKISGLLPSTTTSVQHSKKKTPFQIHEDSSEDQAFQMQTDQNVPYQNAEFVPYGDLTAEESEASLLYSAASPRKADVSVDGDLMEFTPPILSPGNDSLESESEASLLYSPRSPRKSDVPIDGDLMEFERDASLLYSPRSPRNSDGSIDGNLMEFSSSILSPGKDSLESEPEASLLYSPRSPRKSDVPIDGDLLEFSPTILSPGKDSLTSDSVEYLRGRLSPREDSSQYELGSSPGVSQLHLRRTSSPLSPTTHPKSRYGRFLSPSDTPSPVLPPSPYRLRSPSNQLSYSDPSSITYSPSKLGRGLFSPSSS